MILMNDFKHQKEALVKSQLDAMERVTCSGWWVLGQEVSNFEKCWSTFTNTQYAIGVGNGMDALEIGLRSLEIGKGDEVITTAMTAFATVLSILRAGATPVLADINPDTGILDPESVSRCITKNTKAIMVVHLYGQSAPLDEFTLLCENENIFLIEDAAQAHGARFNNKPIGSYGEYAGWSFYPTKNLGAIGDAGAITTNSIELADKAKRMRNYGQSERYYHTDIGLNSRLDELQAAILNERINYLEEWTERRRTIAHMYNDAISNPEIVLLPLPQQKERHVHHLYVIQCKKRDHLQSYLKKQGIQSLIHYPVPIHQQKPTANLSTDPKGMKHTQKHAQQVLSLPCHPGLNDESVMKVIEVINNYKKG